MFLRISFSSYFEENKKSMIITTKPTTIVESDRHLSTTLGKYFCLYYNKTIDTKVMHKDIQV